jgi:hypothetical protein
MTNFGSILGDVLRNYSSVPQSPADVQNVSHNDVYNHYQQFVQQATPQQVYDAHQQAYQQLPQNQQGSIFNSVVGALTHNGVDPQQAGIQGFEPTPQNFAQAGQYISQNPGLLQSVFGQNSVLGSPVAKMVLAGALAVAANQFSNSGNQGTNKGSGLEMV